MSAVSLCARCQIKPKMGRLYCTSCRDIVAAERNRAKAKTFYDRNKSKIVFDKKLRAEPYILVEDTCDAPMREGTEIPDQMHDMMVKDGSYTVGTKLKKLDKIFIVVKNKRDKLEVIPWQEN